MLAVVLKTLRAAEFWLAGEGLCLGVSQRKQFLHVKEETHPMGAEEHNH